MRCVPCVHEGREETVRQIKQGSFLPSAHKEPLGVASTWCFLTDHSGMVRKRGSVEELENQVLGSMVYFSEITKSVSEIIILKTIYIEKSIIF